MVWIVFSVANFRRQKQPVMIDVFSPLFLFIFHAGFNFDIFQSLPKVDFSPVFSFRGVFEVFASDSDFDNVFGVVIIKQAEYYVIIRNRSSGGEKSLPVISFISQVSAVMAGLRMWILLTGSRSSELWHVPSFLLKNRTLFRNPIG